MMRSLALALLGSSALFTSAAVAQTGAATTNAAGANQNQATLADCDRLVSLIEQQKPSDPKVTPDIVRGWKRDNNARACRDNLVRLGPNAANQTAQGNSNTGNARIVVQESAPQIRVQQGQPTVTLHQMQPQMSSDSRN